MSEYIVGAGGDFSTLTAASKAIKPGDVVTILPGVYREQLVCDTTEVTWRAEPGVLVDAPVQVRAPGVTLKGLTVCNCAN